MSTNPLAPLPTTNQAGVINPYQNYQVITHSKFISHIGIAWIDLKTVQKSFMKGSRTVLRKVCGQFNYGTMNAIMGPWKSGKSTLIKSLAGRNNEEIDYESQLFINGDIHPRVVYLDKDTNTNMLLSLTVEELLDFSYRFRNKALKSADRRSAVKELIKNFELKSIENVQLRFCTAEEQLRAQMAMTLAAVERPNLIFVDEPLHDLDAASIEMLITLMKRLCRFYSVATIFSVGQVLDSDILTIFDKLYVLSRGGLCIYEGSVDHLSLYLRESDVLINSKIQTPMERLMKVAAKPNQLTLKLANQTLSTRDDILHMAQKFGVPAPNGIQTEMAHISFRNIFDLFARSALHKYRIYWRSIIAYYTIITVFTVLLTTAFNDNIGAPNSCYNRSQESSSSRFIIMGAREAVDKDLLRQVTEKHIDVIEGQTLLDENMKFLFVICAGLCLFQLVNSANGLNEEVKVAINEHRNGWINISSYFWVKNTIDLVVPFINTVTCGILSYFLTNQVFDHWRFLSFLYALLANVVLSQSLGFAIGIISVFNNRYTTTMILLSYLIMITFSGYLIPMADIDEWLEGFSHLSFLKLSYEIALLSFYGLHRCRSIGYTNSYVLDEMGLDYTETYWRNSVVLLVHFLVYRFIFWAILVSKVNKQPNISRPEIFVEGELVDVEQDMKNK